MNEATIHSAPRSRLFQILDWTLRIVLALAFAAAGAAKLAGAPPMIELFDKLGLGQWFRYVTALVEIAGAALIIVPRTALYGAALLAVTMACAIVAHFTIIGPSAVPASILLLLNLVVIYMRKP